MSALKGAAPALRDDLEVRVEVEPPWPFRMPGAAMDGLTVKRGGVLHRLVHEDGLPVLVRVAVLASGNVLFGASGSGSSRGALQRAVARMRRALGVDLDLGPFVRTFRDDPLIGASVRRSPLMRVRGRPSEFEALSFAICEQLIEFERAVEIQRRMVRGIGRVASMPAGVVPLYRDAPEAGAVVSAGSARLESYGLSAGRAVALVRAAREVERGRVVLDARASPEDLEVGWRRLQLIPGIGAWTVEMLALTGQGRLDCVPAGDLGFLKVVGRILSGGDPRARATEEQVRTVMEPYGDWKGLAGAHLLRSAGLVKTSV